MLTGVCHEKIRTLALLAILAMCSAFSAYAQEVITIGEPNWTSGRAMAGLVKVAIVPGTNAVIFKGMDRSKGEIDVHPDVWIPN